MELIELIFELASMIIAVGQLMFLHFYSSLVNRINMLGRELHNLL